MLRSAPLPSMRAPCVLQVLFTAELQRRLGPGSGVLCFVLHPGEVMTGIARSLPATLERLYVSLFSRILLSPSEGAAHGPAYRRAGSRLSMFPHLQDSGSTMPPSHVNGTQHTEHESYDDRQLPPSRYL